MVTRAPAAAKRGDLRKKKKKPFGTIKLFDNIY
jgi:hypothetical protein